MLAGDEQLELGVDDPQRARDLLATIEGAQCLGDGAAGRLRVMLKGLSAGELNQRLVGDGLAVHALVPQGRRLEELYLARTQDEVR